MRSLNKVLLIGNVGKDPEIRTTQTGKNVAAFSMATSEANDRTEWHRVVAWEKTADIVVNYVKQGSKVFVEGRIQTRTWTDKEGNKKTTVEIVAYQILLLSYPKKAEPVKAEAQEDDEWGDPPF